MADSQWIRDALERYEGALVAHARRITGDLGWARDAVQETFLRLCGRPRDEVAPHLAQWLFTVCRNAAVDRIKKEQVMETVSHEGTDQRPSDEPSPAAAAIRKEECTSIVELLRGLPANQEEVLRLKFKNGLSYTEIHDATGLSIGNVGYLIHTGLASLRERLSGDKLEELLS